MDKAVGRRGLLARVVDYFVHPSFRVDSDVFFRARILIAAMLAFAIVTAVSYGVLLVTLFFGTPILTVYSNVILPTSSLVFIGLLLLTRKKGWYMFCSLTSVFISFVMIIAGICISGGPAVSPAVQLMVIPPLAAYFFGGLRWGSHSVWFSFIALVVLATLHVLGVPFVQAVPSEAEMTLARDIVAFLNLSVISGMAFIYEFTAAALKRERDTEHEKYIRLAKTDPLTGLANRRNFDAMLKERIDLYGAQNPPRRFALGYLDLDGFKPINDQHGHAVGDEVLRAISERLRSSLRGSDFVGRHGGDEFMLLLDMGGNQAALEVMADRLLSSIAQPIKTSVGIVGVTGSLGFAMFPLDAAEIEELVKAADAAMYTAKKQRGTWCFYRKDMAQAPAA